ncbi:salutaridinol 7-o-acetyltransferase [Quercus suber]|uniref:Salutaridinol 7-o-acetyltransferase n=1 Tax=Quercus suber TaxID=58331 RepID=A0AAW0L016_QUESU
MVTEMKFEIMSRKTIKPSIPTPHQHRTFSLSLWTKSFPQYIVQPFSSIPQTPMKKQSSRLQNSLSKTLVHFYPMAGRLNDTASIECNDQGAYFVEAQNQSVFICIWKKSLII